MRVGFVGPGMMGAAMARNLAAAGHEVRGWNRTRPAEAPEGVAPVGSAAEAFRGAEVVVSMLSDDAALRAVVLAPGFLEDVAPGTVHVCASTISAKLADELADRHAAAQVHYVSAPVFGRPDMAAAAQLNIVAAGAPDVPERVQPLFDVLGKRTYVLGDRPATANAAKIVGNMMIGMAVEALSEAAVLSEGAGLPAETFYELMLQVLFSGRVYENYSGKIARAEFEPGFKMALALKDLGLAAELAEAAGRPAPQLEAVRARMAEAVAAGLGERDVSAMADFARRGRAAAGRESG